MANKTIDSKKILKLALIVYAAVFVIGLVMTFVLGPKLDINFSGGTRITYSYSGDVKEADFKDAVKSVIKDDFSVSQNTSFAGDTKTFAINLAGKKSLSTEKQKSITEKLTEKFKDNSFEIYDSTSVSASVAGNFFAKSLVAVLITAALVVIYVGIRFKNIGGVSAALTALCALVLDLLVTFFICVIFRLPIDSNYMAVVLTILGYSLNDTIVVYDRVREIKKYNPQLPINDNMDQSIAGVIKRNIMTSVTTIGAVITIVVVSEMFGLTSLRSFAIPMAFGLLSGCFSSLFIAGPLWVKYREFKDAKKTN